MAIRTPKPCNQSPSVRWIVGDCLSKMKGMEIDSVDLVLASPPYEDARGYDIGFDLRGEAYMAWTWNRYVECLRVSRGLVAWVIDSPTRDREWGGAPCVLVDRLLRTGYHVRKPIIYRRNGVPGSGGPDYFRNDYEFIVVASKRPDPLRFSDVTACGHPPKFAVGGKMSNRAASGKRARRAYTQPDLVNPGNVIDCGAVGGGNIGDLIAHENEAPFPEQLAERLIRSFVPPGGVVLDCFSGSGTTACVAKMFGRNAIAIDIRRSEIAKGKRRWARTAVKESPSFWAEALRREAAAHSGKDDADE